MDDSPSVSEFELSEDEQQLFDEPEDDFEEQQQVWNVDDGALKGCVAETLTKTTNPELSKFERVRLLGARATQLSRGAHPMIYVEKGTSSVEIARKELKQGMLPLCLRRRHPNGLYEDWSTSELAQTHDTQVIDVLQSTV